MSDREVDAAEIEEEMGIVIKIVWISLGFVVRWLFGGGRGRRLKDLILEDGRVAVHQMRQRTQVLRVEQVDGDLGLRM